MNNSFAISLVLALFLVAALLIRRQQGSWLSPSSFFILFWTVVIFFSVLMAPGFYYSPLALLFILSVLLAFYAGGVLVKTIEVEPSEQGRSLALPATGLATQKIFLLYTLLATFFGFLALKLLLQFYDSSISMILSEGWTALSDRMTSERYEGVSLPAPVMICLAITYSGSMAGGFVYAGSRNVFTRLLTLIPFVPVVLFTLVYTARAPLLFQLILFVSSVIVSGVYKQGGQLKLFTPKFIGGMGVLTILITTVFIYTQIMRMDAGYSKEEILMTWQHLGTWFFGNVSGFSVWFDNYLTESFPSWGSYTLGGVYEMLGLGVRKVGLYDTYVNIGCMDEYTNVYTLFRLMIDDYTTYGLYLLFFVFGFLASWLYQSVMKGYLYLIPLLSAVFAMQLWSFVASFFTYNTNIMAIALFLLLLLIVYSCLKKNVLQ